MLLTVRETAERLVPMARFALATGQRQANVRQLRWENVDFARRVAVVWADEAKAGAEIPVPLGDEALARLPAHLGDVARDRRHAGAGPAGDGRVARSADGRPLHASCRGAFARARERDPRTRSTTTGTVESGRGGWTLGRFSASG
jgi:integrase